LFQFIISIDNVDGNKHVRCYCKRNIDPELAALTAVLHDIAVIETMKADKHDEIAESYVRAMDPAYAKRKR